MTILRPSVLLFLPEVFFFSRHPFSRMGKAASECCYRRRNSWEWPLISFATGALLLCDRLFGATVVSNDRAIYRRQRMRVLKPL